MFHAARNARSALVAGLLAGMVAVAACSTSSMSSSGADAAVVRHDAASRADARRDADKTGADAGHDGGTKGHPGDGGGDASAPEAGDAGSDAPFMGLCLDCIENQCMGSGRACEDDATCEMWITCASQCLGSDEGTPCFQACDAEYTSAASLIDPVYACICSSCTTGCPTLDACAHGTDAGP
jgi:hypothetical protein